MKAEPERSCIVTREVMPKAQLLRFVVSPDGEVVPDIAGKLPGRGLYIGASRALLAEAIERWLFSKAAKQPVNIHDDIENRLLRQLEERALQALSLCRKAGEVITGFDKVDAALRSGKVAALLHASDAGSDGVEKLNRLADNALVFSQFSRDGLSRVMGRENAVHVAVLRGKSHGFFIEETSRFALFLGKTTL